MIPAARGRFGVRAPSIPEKPIVWLLSGNAFCATSGTDTDESGGRQLRSRAPKVLRGQLGKLMRGMAARGVWNATGLLIPQYSMGAPQSCSQPAEPSG